MRSVDSNDSRIFTVTTVTLMVVMKIYQSAVSCSLVLKINSVLSQSVTVLHQMQYFHCFAQEIGF